MAVGLGLGAEMVLEPVGFGFQGSGQRYDKQPVRGRGVGQVGPEMAVDEDHPVGALDRRQGVGRNLGLGVGIGGQAQVGLGQGRQVGVFPLLDLAARQAVFGQLVGRRAAQRAQPVEPGTGQVGLLGFEAPGIGQGKIFRIAHRSFP